MLTAHQRLAILRAFPGARIEDNAIRIRRWTIVIRDGRPVLPETEGPTGRREFDGCDEAMELWTHVRVVLGCD